MRKIGSTFWFDNRTKLKVVEASIHDPCLGCYFDSYIHATECCDYNELLGPCEYDSREDGKYIIFKEDNTP